MKNKIDKIFITFCLFLIFLPLLLLLLKIKVDVDYSSRKINGNFKVNFPLRDDYFSIYSYLKSTVFQTNTTTDKVIELKDGWLFCGDNFGDNFSESMGLKVFSKKEIDTLKTNFDRKSKWLKERGIEYYIAVAPNKESVYGDLIPIKKIKTRNTKREQIDSLCKLYSINYIKLDTFFPKKGKTILFHKTDTHWNNYAGFYGYLAILNKIKSNHSNENLVPISINDFKIDTSDVKIGDMNEILRRVKTEGLVVMNCKSKKYPKAIKLKSKYLLPKEYENDPLAYEKRYASNANKLKILFLTDSFGGYTEQFLKENFGETTYIWSHIFNKELIEKEKPDIIIQEFVERNVDYLLNVKN